VLRSGQQFDAILTDIEMPDMNGFEFAEVIKADARLGAMPIIALSSMVSPAAIERGRQAGFHDYVAKFDRPGLIAALKEQTADINQAA
jgi:two-component system, chemotaxis family, sensor kinase CheA